ncbi:adenine phosphoribosyltransferase [Philodulcilactobacillus myokoensis]|uniref:Adenine phosphoribosyltransferase n=1 Tax=Philodulcilactobacillus myokoensis TaxID=2929573 RepID=A0A9W6B0F9_9LACO|nr:adenine phosphoribosyltransferase [Philodulcilactobacillus myokoensis]GLB46183.1 adenine phosphoribosyltransferase [Philodulcilactobacillus myokoensis]
MNLLKYIDVYHNFPVTGIRFNDVSKLMEEPNVFKYIIDHLADYAKSNHADLIVGPEANGFVFGSAVAYKLGIGFAPARKPGKLPGDSVGMSYKLEYGEDSLNLRKEDVQDRKHVVIIDDVFATGGTLKTTANLISDLGGTVVGAGVILELTKLNGRKNINGLDLVSLQKYEG